MNNSEPVGCYPYARLKPVGWDRVATRDELWGRRIELSRKIGIMDCYSKFEQGGWIDNFRVLAEGLDKPHRGGPNSDEFVYKWMEACGYYAAEEGSEEIVSVLENMIDFVCKGQTEDGYINTFYMHPKMKARGVRRFDAENRFEFYDFGHLLQAAMAYYRATSRERLLKSAKLFADLIVNLFKKPNRLPYRMNRGPLHLKREHPNHELAMIELYRLTGNRSYLDFAKQTLDEYEYWNQQENNGHVVQETLLNCAAADLYMETGDPVMLEAIHRLWDDMEQTKMYITGGAGSRYVSESFGGEYELPNGRAYQETCAVIMNVFWAYRMLLITRESKYADVMERALYNGVLAGMSLSGTEYTYQNPLTFNPSIRHISTDADGELDLQQTVRWKWHNCPCCPPNLHRLLASLKQYIYTENELGIQVHLYIGSELSLKLPNGENVTIVQRTLYPWDDKVELQICTASPQTFELSLRIPGWCRGAKVGVNTEEMQEIAHGGRYVTLHRAWEDGDVITLVLPQPVRLEQAHPHTSNTGRVAVCRGPLVYCIEAEDYPDTDVFDVVLPRASQLQAAFQPDLLGGVVTITGKARAIDRKPWNGRLYLPLDEGDSLSDETVPFQAIPYFAWANRSIGKMQTWILYKCGEEVAGESV